MWALHRCEVKNSQIWGSLQFGKDILIGKKEVSHLVEASRQEDV